MLVVVGIVVFVAALLASIGLHELGHLIPAKKFGVKVTQYMIGFGPTLFSRRKGETEYGFKLVPLGGYVRMVGMFPPGKPSASAEMEPVDTETETDKRPAGVRAEPAGETLPDGNSKTFFGSMIGQAREEDHKEIVTEEDERRAFYNLAPWKKIVVMMSGPVTNLIIAIILFVSIFALFGVPAATNQIETVTPCFVAGQPVTAPIVQNGDNVCPAGSARTPAAAAGIRPGDRIVAVNTKPADSWEDFLAELKNAQPGENTVTVARDDGEAVLPVTLVEVPVVQAGAGKRVFLGVSPQFALVRTAPSEVPGQIARIAGQSVKGLVSFPAKIGALAKTVVSDTERDPEGPVGVVGVSRVSGEVAAADVPPSWKFVQILGLVASINLFLFLFNMLPILPLDGGHIVGAVYEAGKRKLAKWQGKPDPGPVDVARALPIAYAVTGVFILISLLILYADIFKPIMITK